MIDARLRLHQKRDSGGRTWLRERRWVRGRPRTGEPGLQLGNPLAVAPDRDVLAFPGCSAGCGARLGLRLFLGFLVNKNLELQISFFLRKILAQFLQSQGVTISFTQTLEHFSELHPASVQVPRQPRPHQGSTRQASRRSVGAALADRRRSSLGKPAL